MIDCQTKLANAMPNAVLGTATAWVLVRDTFPGKAYVNAVIDLPFALPTIVAGLVLIMLVVILTVRLLRIRGAK